MFDVRDVTGNLFSDEVAWEATVAAYRAWDIEPPAADPADDGEWIPADLDSWPPGPELAVVLADIDVDRLFESDRVMVLKAWEKMAAHVHAETYRTMTSIVDAYTEHVDDPAITEPAAAAEIATALRWTRRTAETELGTAMDLRTRLPKVFDAMRAGRIDRRRGWLFLRHTSHLPIAAAREVTDRLVDAAGRWTTGQLTERLRRTCLEVDPESTRHRYQQAATERRVTSAPQPDGTVNLYGLDLPAVRVSEAMDRINRYARQLKTRSETRSIDQLRADVFLDLLTGTTSDLPRTGTVHLTVDLATLTGLAGHPGHLAGYGPIIADLTRHATRALTDGTWSYTITHPDSGQPLHHGTTRRRPTTTQRRRLTATHPTCVFPGCRMPAINCDLDHRQRWTDGGPTHDWNLAPLCRHHHMIRHHTRWTYTPTPDGDHHWTSPLGHTHTTSGRDP